MSKKPQTKPDNIKCQHGYPHTHACQGDLVLAIRDAKSLSVKLTAENNRLAARVEAFAWLEYETCDLRCVSVPTGGDDYDVEWIVIEHYMAEPCEREIGRGATPLEAITIAKALLTGAIHPE